MNHALTLRRAQLSISHGASSMSTKPEFDGLSSEKPPRPDRRKIDESLEIEWGSSTLTCRVLDIGPSGLFIELSQPLWLGATFAARLMRTPPILLNCIVRRVEPGKGFAVSFDLPEEEGKTELQRLLATLPSA
jgi:hypothetical protein